MAPVCFKCQTKMNCTKVGVSIGIHRTNYVYTGDLFTCYCGNGIVTNFGEGSRLSVWKPDIWLD